MQDGTACMQPIEFIQRNTHSGKLLLFLQLGKTLASISFAKIPGLELEEPAPDNKPVTVGSVSELIDELSTIPQSIINLHNSVIYLRSLAERIHSLPFSHWKFSLRLIQEKQSKKFCNKTKFKA